jgi:hypothetical protein
MSYQDKFGVTALAQAGVDRFDISWDYDDDPTDKTQRKAVFLVVPKTAASDHEHIELTRQGARDLRDWLTAYLEDTLG